MLVSRGADRRPPFKPPKNIVRGWERQGKTGLLDRKVNLIPVCSLLFRKVLARKTADLSTTLRSGRDDNSVATKSPSFPGNTDSCLQTELSSRPERTRISCHATLDKAACAPFFKERRMMFVNATNFYRKSGVGQWRDLRFLPHFQAFFRSEPTSSAQARTAAIIACSCAASRSLVLGIDELIAAETCPFGPKIGAQKQIPS
jgi:hypothetical protein